jgi:hypothetical protein
MRDGQRIVIADDTAKFQITFMAFGSGFAADHTLKESRMSDFHYHA